MSVISHILIVSYSDHYRYYRRQHHCHGQCRVNEIIFVFVIALIKAKPTNTNKQRKP